VYRSETTPWGDTLWEGNETEGGKQKIDGPINIWGRNVTKKVLTSKSTPQGSPAKRDNSESTGRLAKGSGAFRRMPEEPGLRDGGEHKL